MKRLLFILLAAALAPLPALALSDSQLPTKIPTYWGTSAPGGNTTCPIPIPSQISIQPGRASWIDGFPPVTFLPSASGGIPPWGQDFNGVFCQLSQWTRWYNAIGGLPYDSTFQTAVGGYPAGAVAASVAYPGVYWLSSVDNNTSNPDAGGANWTMYQLPPAIYTAGGSANSQTTTIGGVFGFNSLLGRIFQITPASTNTAATVLAVSGLTPKNVLKQALLNGTTSLYPLTGGEMQAGKTAMLFWDGTEFVLMNPYPVPTNLVTGQVYFQESSATAVTLVPDHGSSLVIQGQQYQIPAGGIAASNSSTFVSGTGGLALAVSTMYDVFVFNNGGTLTLDFWPTTSGTHMSDTTAGNVGIEVRNAGGGTPDGSRSYVGKVQTNASAQFQRQGIGTISWFSRRLVTWWGPDDFANHSTNSLTPVELYTGGRTPFITFAGSMQSILSGMEQVSPAGNYAQLWIGLDGINQVGFITETTQRVPVSVPGYLPVTEGSHYLTPMGSVQFSTSVTGTFGDMQIYMAIWG